ncbi:MAG TPA: class I lanthipeptide [Bacteroidia bacterium]|jgi:natural product precursor|nr:class I lanthipeptide [Bacteroidia bacterium]
MKTFKLKKKFSLKKEKIATLNKEQLSALQGGGTVTWVGCQPQITRDCWGLD